VRRTQHPRAVTAVATAALAVVVLSACSAKKQGSASPVPAANQSTVHSGAAASAVAAPAVVTVSPASGKTGVNPVRPVTVAVAGGRLATVALTNAEGKHIKGTVAANKLSWSSAEPLGYDKAYTVTIAAINTEGRESTTSSTFTTVKPDNLTMPYIQTAAGGAIDAGTTFGVGQVARVHFDEAIGDRKAAQDAITVTTTPAQVGAFNWLSDQDVYWRTKDYLKPGTKVAISVKAYGRNFGTSLYGQADSSTWFKVGAQHISVADDNDKLVKVYSGGKLVRTMPTSMGRHTSIPGDTGPIDLRTNSGPHVVVGGETKINMNSASFGLSKGANAYKTIVPVGVRISYDGEYVHWADWSIWAQGNTDTSHGCLNVSPDNAWWFYNFSVPGDIVDVQNTGRPLALWNSGYWTASWAEWVAGTAK
jgi:lipoprotein-anchoring transpeptidase ErfK/SrfK